MVASRVSPVTRSTFDLLRCPGCRFVFVASPRTDFADLYNDAYYAGRGADTSVDYVAEMRDPATIRTYEWRGILHAVERLAPVDSTTRWLDFGCGLGGLVRWVRAHRGCSIFGYEDGYAADFLEAERIPRFSSAQLASQAGTFDVVTAIEVLEHSTDPNATLTQITSLLRPGGTVFLTTGNAEPFADRLTTWSYTAVPDVHVSFFEPTTLAGAMTRAGLEPLTPGYGPGFDDIIRYKVLKGLGVRRRSVWERLMPWPLVSRVVDRKYRVSAMPAGRRP
jgi:SAM-dependent methyltransferase